MKWQTEPCFGWVLIYSPTDLTLGGLRCVFDFAMILKEGFDIPGITAGPSYFYEVRAWDPAAGDLTTVFYPSQGIGYLPVPPPLGWGEERGESDDVDDDEN